MQLSEVNERTMRAHSKLLPGDRCHYLFNFVSGSAPHATRTNSLITHLKAKPGAPESRWKNEAIRQCALHLREALDTELLRTATFVPVPPSKTVEDPGYDDRIERVCRAIDPSLDVRSLIRLAVSLPESHKAERGKRTSLEVLARLYQLDEALICPGPAQLVVVDDLLTSGTHYRAMHSVLSARFPNVPIRGVFIARRSFPPTQRR